MQARGYGASRLSLLVRSGRLSGVVEDFCFDDERAVRRSVGRSESAEMIENQKSRPGEGCRASAPVRRVSSFAMPRGGWDDCRRWILRERA
jgi:hypothetical protein